MPDNPKTMPGQWERSVLKLVRIVLLSVAAVLPAVGQEPDKPAGFAGSETCQTCHEDIFKAFQANKHFVVENDRRRGWEKRACESCHGAGAKHAESASADDIFQPAKRSAAEQDKTCLRCHMNQTVATGRITSGHARRQAGCTSCHSVHDAARQLHKGDARATNAQCGACHSSVWAQFQKPHHHKLPEGAMSCVDCHNPHGSTLARAVRTTSANEPGCLRCHGDKRGPFTFEHAPLRIEGCGACHEPHGSANPRMLARAEVRFQCLECHSNITRPGVTNTLAGGIPPAFHDLRNPRYRNCTVCHVKIHGSHVNRSFLR